MYKIMDMGNTFINGIDILYIKKGGSIMKVCRDIFFAVCIGIFGGFAVTILSYYNQHKSDGVEGTLLAVANSARTIREAYTDVSEESYDWNVDPKVLAGGIMSSDTGEYIDDRIPVLSDEVLSAFADLTEEEAGDDVVSAVVIYFKVNLRSRISSQLMMG